MAADLKVEMAKILVAQRISMHNFNYSVGHPDFPKDQAKVLPDEIKATRLDDVIELSFGAWTCFMSWDTDRINKIRKYLNDDKTKIEYWGDQGNLGYVMVKR